MSTNRRVRAARTERLLAAVVVALIPLAYGHAACVTPVGDPSNAPRSSWNDVLDAKAQKTSNPVISEIQDIEATGTGDVNLDFYALTFDSGGRSAEQWLDDFRANLGRYIYRGTTYSVTPFDYSNKVAWNSKNPRGAVLVFNLSQLFGVPFERGAVVVSCIDSTSFIFSTVSIHGTLNPGDHPVSGNRGFGFVKNQNGSIAFFTKAADRLKGNNKPFSVIGSEKTFTLGAKVWNGLIENLTSEMAPWNPRNRVTYRRKESYPPPSNSLSPPTNLRTH